MGRFVVLASFRQPIRLHTQGWAPYPSDRMTVWCEAHGPARVRSNLAAVRSIDRLDSVERFPLHTSLWEVLGAGQLLGIFTQSATPAGDSFPLVVPIRFLRIKQKYRTLHPGGNKQANVQYYIQKNKLSLIFLDAFASHPVVN